MSVASLIFSDVLLNPEEVRVVGGSSFRLDDQNSYSGVLKDIYIHEDFSRSSLENNVAVGHVRFSEIR